MQFYSHNSSSKMQTLFLFYCDIIDTQHVCLRCKMWWFDIYVYYETIITIKLVNTCILAYHYHFLVIIIFKIHSLDNFPVYNMVTIMIVTTLCIRSVELTHLIAGSLHPLTNFFPFPPNASPWQPPNHALPVQLLQIPRVTSYSICLCLTHFT